MEPKNMVAIREWVNKNRPDLKGTLEPVFNNTAPIESSNGIILLLTIGFAAGREFQKSNPDLPLSPSSYL
jgi:hypothetical protein